MHTTALCSPSRSCFLTGRNHHSNGMSCITEGAEGYPGSNGIVPFENGFLSEVLLLHGYATYCVGRDLSVTIPIDIGITEGLACGRDPGSGVSPEYTTPFEFTGTIHDVLVDVSGELIVDTEAQMRAVLAHQ